MTSVAPPPPPPPMPPAGNGAAQLTVSIPPQASVELSKLALESLISGLVKQPTAQGEIALQTNFGLLQFKAPFILPPDSEATFKLVQTVPNVQIQLVALNGKTLPPNTTATRVTILAAQNLQGTMPNVTQGNTTSPTVLNNATNATATPASLSNLNSVNGLRAFVLAPGSQGGQNMSTLAPPSTSPSLGATTNIQGNQQSFPATGTPSNQPSLSVTGHNTATGINSNILQTVSGKIQIQQGFQLNVRLLSVQLPDQSQTQLSQPFSGTGTNTVITQGTVQGQTALAQPIIKIPQGLIALDTTTKMPEGTQVRLEILSSSRTIGADTGGLTNGKETGLDKVGQKWPALDEALSQLRTTNPLLVDNFFQNIMPKPDSRLAVNLIFFLKALGRGTFKDWADEKAIRALSKSNPDLLKRLESDFTEISNKRKSSNTTDWKIAYIPIQDNGELHQIRIAQRDHQEEEKGSNEDPGIRFVFDLYFSKFGAMQLDGLTKNKAKKFDLILRTHTALPGHVRKGIHDIYAHSMDAIGFDGKISFQVTPHFVDVEGAETKASELNLGMLV